MNPDHVSATNDSVHSGQWHVELPDLSVVFVGLHSRLCSSSLSVRHIAAGRVHSTNSTTIACCCSHAQYAKIHTRGVVALFIDM